MQIQEYYRIEKMENKHFWYKGMRKIILDFLDKYVKKPARILDAGCGSGGRALDCAAFGRVTAVDISDIAIRLTSRKNIPVVKKADICLLPFNPNSFDAVLCLDVIYHRNVKDDSKALKECYRVLSPGGILMLRVPAFEILRGTHDLVVYTKKRYSRKEIRGLVKTAGFRILRLSYANMVLSVPLVAKRLFEKFFIRDHKSHSDSTLPPAILNKLFYLLLNMENFVLKFVNLPFGSSVICVAQKPGTNYSCI